METSTLKDLSTNKALLRATRRIQSRERRDIILDSLLFFLPALSGLAALCFFFPYLSFLPVLVVIPFFLWVLKSQSRKHLAQYRKTLYLALTSFHYGKEALYSEKEETIAAPKVAGYLPMNKITLTKTIKGSYEGYPIELLQGYGNYDFLSETISIKETQFAGYIVSLRSPLAIQGKILVSSRTLGKIPGARIMIDDRAFSDVYQVYSDNPQTGHLFTEQFRQKLLGLRRSFPEEKGIVILFSGEQMSVLFPGTLKEPKLKLFAPLLDNLSKLDEALIAWPEKISDIMLEE